MKINTEFDGKGSLVLSLTFSEDERQTEEVGMLESMKGSPSLQCPADESRTFRITIPVPAENEKTEWAQVWVPHHQLAEHLNTKGYPDGDFLIGPSNGGSTLVIYKVK